MVRVTNVGSCEISITNEMGVNFAFWRQDVFGLATRAPGGNRAVYGNQSTRGCWYAKHISNHDVWCYFENPKPRDVIVCDAYTSRRDACRCEDERG